jgi:hypothetical protein
VASGEGYRCARKTDNTLWCWGKDDAGPFGNGSLALSTTSPVQVTTSVSVAAAAMGWHTCLIKTTATLGCAGGNGTYQIGSSQAQTSPAQVSGGGTWGT